MKKFINKHGFTLVEMSVSIVMVGVITLAVMQMFTYGRTANSIDEERLVAYNLLQAKVEEIKTKDFSVNVAEPIFTYASYGNYPMSVNEVTPALGNAYLKSITVSINWTSSYGVLQNETFRFLVANTS